MARILLSLTQPAPPGFRFDPAPASLRTNTFCLFSEDRRLGKSVVLPLAADAVGLLVHPGPSLLQCEQLGSWCQRWEVPAALMPWLTGWAEPMLELLERANVAEDAALAQAIEAERAVRDRVTLAREHCDFRNSLLKEVRGRRRMENALREADRRKDEFLAVLSHELRNPLAPIVNSIYVLEHSPAGSPEARRSQTTIARQVEHLSRIVDDLLDVTRIARGKVRLETEQVDLGEVVRRVAEDHQATFADAGVQLRVTISPAPLVLLADRIRLAQVMGNLLQNARKFTPGGGTVQVELRRLDDTAVLSVRDTGVGMSPEVLDRLFEPFAQGDHTLARSAGGLGLGLALVKQLVELHGGRAKASSAGPGRGAQITITLPILVGNQPALAPLHGSGPRARRRVLVIEDNADAAYSLRDVLGMLGHEVQVALDGTAGLAAAREMHPEVIVCDIGLPGMNGYEVARAVRADRALTPVLLIALTGYAQPEDSRRAKDAGFDAHLAKPPSLDVLGSLLQSAH